MRLSEAIELYTSDKRTALISPHTLMDYGITFRKFRAYLEIDPDLSEINPDHIRGFLAENIPLISSKTLLNYYIGLSSFWTWATRERELCTSHVVQKVQAPKADKTTIIPFTQREVKLLLVVAGHSKSWTSTKGNSSNPWDVKDISASRNRAIVLFLLDSGVRVTELCGVNVQDVRPGERGVHLVRLDPAYAKGRKERMVPISTRTWEAVQEYLQLRGTVNPEDPLFASEYSGQRMKRDAIQNMLERLGGRAKIKSVHAHRFRHTFAINFLRNGGDGFTLQAILGHTTMEMVKRYISLASTDLERNHAKASPVINWEL